MGRTLAVDTALACSGVWRPIWPNAHAVAALMCSSGSSDRQMASWGTPYWAGGATTTREDRSRREVMKEREGGRRRAVRKGREERGYEGEAGSKRKHLVDSAHTNTHTLETCTVHTHLRNMHSAHTHLGDMHSAHTHLRHDDGHGKVFRVSGHISKHHDPR